VHRRDGRRHRVPDGLRECRDAERHPAHHRDGHLRRARDGCREHLFRVRHRGDLPAGEARREPRRGGEERSVAC